MKLKHYCPKQKAKMTKDKLPCNSKNDCTIVHCYTYRALKE